MTTKNTEQVEFNTLPSEKETDESPTQPSDLAEEDDSSLQALVREQQSYAREQLLKELGREPTQREADEWLSAHTEGY